MYYFLLDTSPGWQSKLIYRTTIDAILVMHAGLWNNEFNKKIMVLRNWYQISLNTK